MADSKITALDNLTSADPANDMIPIVDVSATPPASGNTKRISINNILACSPTATLASATITGDLTVATDRLKVVTGSTAVQTGATTQLQVGTTSWPSTVIGKSGSRSLFGNTGEVVLWTEAAPAIGNYSTLFVTAKTGAGATTMGGLQIRAGIENASNSDGFVSLWTSNSAAGGFVERYKIDSTGVATWSNVGGVAGTAMTLNSTGLGVGTSNFAYKLNAAGFIAAVDPSFTGTGGALIGAMLNNDNTAPGLDIRRWTGTAGNHGTTYISTDFTGATYFYNGQQASNTKATSLKMTLDASGNLLVGTTSSASNAGIGLKAAYSATAPYYSTVGSSNASNAYSYLLYSTTDAAFKFYVSYSGTVSATNGTISAISDSRLKENVQDIDVGLGAILALKPRKFDWKAGKGKDIKGDRGFIAQEFEQVFPNLVDEWKDNAPEGEAPYKSVRQDLIPVLVKAIQELAAEVNALKNA